MVRCMVFLAEKRAKRHCTHIHIDMGARQRAIGCGGRLVDLNGATSNTVSLVKMIDYASNRAARIRRKRSVSLRKIAPTTRELPCRYSMP